MTPPRSATTLAVCGLAVWLTACSSQSAPQPEPQAPAPAARSCQDGDAPACFAEARQREQANPRENLVRAGLLYTRACKDRHAEACFRVATLSAERGGPIHDEPRAARFAKNGC